MNLKGISSHNSTTFFVYLSFLFCLLILTTNTLSASDTKISSSRNSNRANICTYFTASYTSEER